MSVLIKGIEMPETCDDCQFHRYHSHGEYVCVATPMFYPMNLANSKGIRKDWCPLVELPEHHGDLVDVNEIRWDDHYDPNGNLSEYKIAYSDEMPDTIVEAE